MGNICFFGQRKLSPAEAPLLEEELERLALRLAGYGPAWFLTGGAPGFETLAARGVLRARRNRPGIRLALVLPCEGQTWGWSAADAAAYREIFAQADSRFFLARGYYPGCIQRQGRWMVDRCGLCVCRFSAGAPGGHTGQLVAYARRRGVPVLCLGALGPGREQLPGPARPMRGLTTSRPAEYNMTCQNNANKRRWE